jgi:hypothetical protein
MFKVRKDLGHIRGNVLVGRRIKIDKGQYDDMVFKVRLY